MAVENGLKKGNIPFARANVGNRYVLELLQKNDWQLGGEGSGHIICLDKHTTGDGIISALQVLYAMRDSGKSLAELAHSVTLYPQQLINVKVPKGFDWRADAMIEAAQVEAEPILIIAAGSFSVPRVPSPLSCDGTGRIGAKSEILGRKNRRCGTPCRSRR